MQMNSERQDTLNRATDQLLKIDDVVCVLNFPNLCVLLFHGVLSEN